MSFTINVSDIKPGMILAENVFCGDTLLLASGSVIKQSYIERLKMSSIPQVSVYEEMHEEEIFLNPVEIFYKSTYKVVGDILRNLKDNGRINISQAFSIVEGILDLVLTNRDGILLLTGYRSNFDIYYHAHSLDVCIYSLIAAKVMGLSYEESVQLGIGALLHDIGKIKIPERILNKKGTLTVDEFEQVKNHPIYGYYMLKDISGIDPVVPRIVLEHHERCNGSGYPNNLRSEELCRLSKIVAIADIYDALTSDRIYRKKVLPHEAAEYLISISNSQLDSEITKIFLKNIAIYPKGCQVLLNTNQVAAVIDSNPAMPLRPLLEVFTDQERNPLSNSYKIDLSSNLSVFITHIFS